MPSERPDLPFGSDTRQPENGGPPRIEAAQSASRRTRSSTVARRSEWHRRALEAGREAFFGCADMQDIEDVVRAYLGALGAQGQHTASSLLVLYVDGCTCDFAIHRQGVHAQSCDAAKAAT